MSRFLEVGGVFLAEHAIASVDVTKDLLSPEMQSISSFPSPEELADPSSVVNSIKSRLVSVDVYTIDGRVYKFEGEDADRIVAWIKKRSEGADGVPKHEYLIEAMKRQSRGSLYD